MNYIVPNDMAEVIKSKFDNYVDCLKNEKELPQQNLLQLKEQYVKLLTIRFRGKLKLTVARRAAKYAVNEYFEKLMQTIN